MTLNTIDQGLTSQSSLMITFQKNEVNITGNDRCSLKAQ